MSNCRSLSVLGGVAMLVSLANPLCAQQTVAPNLPNLFKPGGARQSDPKAVDIAARYLEAIGGKAVLSKIKDRKTSYTNTLYQPTSEAKAEITLMMKGHYNLREEWTLDYKIHEDGPPLAFVQIYNGDLEEAWVQVLGRVDSLEGKTLLVFVHAKFMDDFLCHWKDDGYTLTFFGEAEVDTGKGPEICDIVSVTDFTGRQNERYFFSKESGLLLKKQWRDTTRNPKKPMKREQYFKRYKSIPFMDDSGLAIRFSLHQEIYADGDLDTEREYKLVQFNSGLSDKLFERPEGEPGPVVSSSGRVDPAVKLPVSNPAIKKVEGSAGKLRPRGTKGPAGPALKKPTPTPPPTPKSGTTSESGQ